MKHIRLLAALVIALGAIALSSPPAFARGGGACCTSGNGEETCCGERCWADGDRYGAPCTINPLACLPE